MFGLKACSVPVLDHCHSVDPEHVCNHRPAPFVRVPGNMQKPEAAWMS